MGLSDFWINNNGKKEQLNNAKHGIRKDQVAKKYQNLFDAYDTNKDGTLEESELKEVFTGLAKFAGADKVLDANENQQVASLFASQAGIEDADFMGFVKSVSDASEEIESSTTTKGEDGGEIIETKYSDGTIETMYYYPDGEFKMKKLQQDVVNTEVLYSVGQDYDKTYTKDEIDELIKKRHNEDVKAYEATQAKATKENGIFAIPPLQIKDYTKVFMNNNVTPHTNTTEIHRREEKYSPKYIAQTLGVDISTDEGKKILERLSQLPEAAMNEILDGKGIKELLADNELTPTFDNLSNVLEIVYGVTLRDEEELKASEPQRNKLITQIKAVNMMSDLYEMIAEWNDQYTDGLGLFGMGAEGIGYIINKLGIDGENHYQFADSCREWSKRASELKPLNPEKFNEGFKNIYGKDAKKWGIDFDEKAFNKLFSIVEANKATNEKGELTQEYKDAILKACNIVADNPNESTYNQVMNGFGEALLMVMSLGLASEAEGGQVLARTAMSTFGKLGTQIASKQAGNKLLQGALRYSGKAVSLLGPAITEGTKMATYTAITGTAANITNRVVKSDSEENSLEKFVQTEGQVLDAAKSSFGFGAFAGVFGATVTPKVVNAVSKTSSKVVKSLSENFAKGSVDATEVYAKVLEKSIPTKLGEAAAFATDIVGFTGFETVLALVNNMDGFPDKISVDDVTNLIKEEFKEQGYSLGQMKVISHLIMWMSGSRSARMNSAKYLKENLPQLKGVKVEETNGKYNIKLSDGRTIECKNANEMISSLHLMVRGETAFSSKFDKKAETQGSKVAEKQTKVEGNAETNEPLTLSQRIENANSREDFVALRDEIKKMPQGEEKTTAFEKYTKKYNEWIQSPDRPDVRMEYKSEDEETMENSRTNTKELKNEIVNILSDVEIKPYGSGQVTKIPDSMIQKFIDLIPDTPTAIVLSEYLNKYKDDSFQANKFVRMFTKLKTPEDIKVFVDIIKSPTIGEALKTPDSLFMRAGMNAHGVNRTSVEYLEKVTEAGLDKPIGGNSVINFEEVDCIMKCQPEQREVLTKLYASKLFSRVEFYKLFKIDTSHIDLANLDKIDEMIDGYKCFDSMEFEDAECLLNASKETLNIINSRNLLKTISNRKQHLAVYEVLSLANVSDEIWSNIQKRNLFASIEGRDGWLDMDDIIEYAKIPDEQWQKIQDKNLLTFKTSDGDYLTALETKKLSNYSAKEQQEFDNLVDLKDSNGKQIFSTSNIIKLLLLPQEKLQFAKELVELKTYEDKPFFDGEDILLLCDMTPEQINIARQRGLFSELSDAVGSSRKFHFKAYDIIELSSVSNERWEQMESLLMSNSGKVMNYIELAKMTDEQILRIPRNKDCDSSLIKAVQLDEAKWNKYKNDFLSKDINIDIYNLEEVLNLDEAQYNLYKELADIKFGDKYDYERRFTSHDILEILKADLDTKGISRIKNDLAQIAMRTREMCKYAKVDDKAFAVLIENYLNPTNATTNIVGYDNRTDTIIKFAEGLAYNEHREISKADLNYVFNFIDSNNIDFVLQLLTDKDVLFSTSTIKELINNSKYIDRNGVIKLSKDKNICENEMFSEALTSIACLVTEENYTDVETLLNTLAQQKYMIPEAVSHIIGKCNDIWDKDQNPAKIALAQKLVDDPKVPNEIIHDVLGNSDFDYDQFVENVYNNPEYYKVLKNARTIQEVIINNTQSKNANQNAVKEVYHIYNKLIENPDVVEALLKNSKDFSSNDMISILKNTYAGNKDLALKLISNYKNMELLQSQIPLLLNNENGLTYKQIQKLNRTLGKQKVAALSNSDLLIADKFVDLYGKQNINEIPIKDKKDILRSLVSSNTGLFGISEDLSKDFPLIPKNQEEYCSLLPSIVRSLGIETNELTPEQRITMFNSSMGNLSQSLAKLSDTDFAQMTITQEYPKDKFIFDVLDKVKALPKTERQKVYDYFGFELHHNKNNETGFSITGYPVNLNNGKKLAQIEDPKTKVVVEALRPDVIRFSENNKIKCSNPQIEQLLNEVIAALPELRTAIGKAQHGTHDFDVMQHSLKVMQKVTQDSKFATLNESDQKIMLLASLMHDITKAEATIDRTHANESSFDTYFITQKFKLTREEGIKLHTIIKSHEWLSYVNTAKSSKQLTKRLQSVSYDLHQGNLLDMVEIFTHADLKAVKKDDTFHDTTEGQSRIGFDGTVRSFGESANVYMQKLREYANELKNSKPLLPQTKFPKASKIDEAITKVNPDGSTNIKGVYKDKDGLVIIKFNEVEDWEAIGFPKGSKSHGIEIKKGEKGDGELLEDVNTGNIKFFVHGLNYSNQLAKFDAFSLVDSDVLLSVSYAERPESKFRFFRPQGVLLDMNSEYVHGGGKTDAGSGCNKTIQDFKKDYIFGGHREDDRLYVSELIKTTTGMTDEQYVEFVEKNKEKSLLEIEPVEIRDKLIKAFATVNSNTRGGKRAYNEMYISNPNEVMGVFAYSLDYKETIGNPVDFLNRTSIGKYEQGYGKVGDISVAERTSFLRQYALERNLPFIIFGD